MKPTLLVLAAGMGSRYGGLKQADNVGPSGETIIDYSIHDAIKAGFEKVVLVIRENIRTEMQNLLTPRWGDKIQIEYAIQEVNVPVAGIDLPERKKPWGTAHAVMVAKSLINEPFTVINADDFYGADAFKTMYNYLNNLTAKNEFSMVGYILKNTLSDHGFVSRGVTKTDADNNMASITELTHIERIEGKVCFKDADGVDHELDENSYVSMNFWGFTPAFFEAAEKQFKTFVEENRENEKAEFFIPTVVDKMKESGLEVKVLESDAMWMGITYKPDKAVVTEKLQKLVEAGEYPESLFEK